MKGKLVKIPEEVAEAIRYFKDSGFSNSQLIDLPHIDAKVRGDKTIQLNGVILTIVVSLEQYQVIKEYWTQNGSEEYAKAIVIGYETVPSFKFGDVVIIRESGAYCGDFGVVTGKRDGDLYGIRTKQMESGAAITINIESKKLLKVGALDEAHRNAIR